MEQEFLSGVPSPHIVNRYASPDDIEVRKFCIMQAGINSTASALFNTADVKLLIERATEIYEWIIGKNEDIIA